MMEKRESKFSIELSIFVWLEKDMEIKHVETKCYDLNCVFPNFMC